MPRLPTYIYVLATAVVFKSKAQYMEMLIGLFFLLVVSDGRENIHYFAEEVKPMYIALMAVFLLIDGNKFTPPTRFYMRFIPFFIVAVICVFKTPPENLQ